MNYLILILPAFILSIYAQMKVKSTFEKYSKVRSSRGYSGADVASNILRRNGMQGKVNIEGIRGKLSDHYDPRSRTVRLSENVYGQNSLAALGVAAHECGHAIQHEERYGMLEIRDKLVPATNFASSASFPLVILGFIINSAGFLFLGIILFSIVVLFHLVTLPVELNASRRAVVQLSEAGLISNNEVPAVKKVLGAAAFTYLAATLMAVANLMYYLSIFMGSDE